MRLRSRFFSKFFFSALLAGLVIGCGSLTSLPEQNVSKRANEWLKVRLKGDVNAVYDFYTSGYRAAVPLESFRGRFGGAAVWVDAEVVSVACESESKCKALIRVGFKPLVRGGGGQIVSTHFDETWLLEDGQWWLFEPIASTRTPAR